jgi:hypothetical protein
MSVFDKRRSPREKAVDQRVERASAEAREKHPDADELTYAWFGGELYVHVWVDGKNVAVYQDVVDDIEAALSNPGARG